MIISSILGSCEDFLGFYPVVGLGFRVQGFGL